MNFLKHIWRLIVLWFVLGMCYTTIELLFRGVTYVQMLWVGGLAGVLIGLIDKRPAYYNRLMWQQCFLGTLITLAVELSSGWILNIKLHLGIWDYSGLPFNFYGQICLRAAITWFFLMPLAIYADDWLRWKLFYERRPSGGLLANYLRLFRGR